MNQLRALAALLSFAAAAVAAPQKHPHFDDGGTLVWYTKLADAKAAAKQADRLIFVEYGREA